MASSDEPAISSLARDAESDDVSDPECDWEGEDEDDLEEDFETTESALADLLFAQSGEDADESAESVPPPPPHPPLAPQSSHGSVLVLVFPLSYHVVFIPQHALQRMVTPSMHHKRWKVFLKSSIVWCALWTWSASTTIAITTPLFNSHLMRSHSESGSDPPPPTSHIRDEHQPSFKHCVGLALHTSAPYSKG